MQLKGKKAMVMIEDMFNDYEFIYPYYRLLEAGLEVQVVGPEAGKSYAGKSGTTARSTLSASQADAGDFDVLVIPGGYAPDHMRRHKEMVDLVRAMVEKDKVVGAICHAGWMLASAEVLQGKKMTSFYAIKDDMVHAGADWVDQEVVVDKKLVTSRTPDDLPAFMRSILELM
ncbi:MAG: type 1 glutamine amidotransferase [Desulfovermiculus sp.]|nr:type 1 glutamine amidotransferase [Desulfovermiculus sp.]